MTGPGYSVSAAASTKEVAEQIKQILLHQISEREKTQRILIVGCTALLALAALIPVFAPSGRAVPSAAVSVGLVVLTLGAIGVSSFKLKAFGADIDAKTQEIMRLSPEEMTKQKCMVVSA